MRKCLSIFLLSIFSLLAGTENTLAQSSPYYYYVVIGVFGFHKNAKNYTTFANELGLQTDYGYHPTRELYYVYIFYHPVKSESVRVTLDTRKTRKYVDAHEMFLDTWVYGTDELQPMTNNLPDPEPVAVSNESESDATDPGEVVRVVEDAPTNSENSSGQSTEEASEDVPDPFAKPDNSEPEKPELEEDQHVLYFNTYNGTNLREVKTEIQVVDALRSQLAETDSSHKYVVVTEPNRKAEVVLVSDMFGYRKLSHRLNLRDPVTPETENYVEMMGDTIIVDFEMVRYRLGDLVTMYNVYFYKDAALIRPESKYEMDELLAMLRENPNYNIMIHGHTNGNAFGPIIKPAEGSSDYFTLDGEIVETRGSARKLSEERSNTMKRWLMDQGIGENRIDAKGWGGRRMLYDKKSPNADKNVRVEIEILRE